MTSGTGPAAAGDGALDAGAPPAELFHEHVLALDSLVTAWRGQKWVDLPGHLRGVRRERRVEVTPPPGDTGRGTTRAMA